MSVFHRCESTYRIWVNAVDGSKIASEYRTQSKVWCDVYLKIIKKIDTIL